MGPIEAVLSVSWLIQSKRGQK